MVYYDTATFSKHGSFLAYPNTWITFKIHLFTFKGVQGLAPDYLCNLIKLHKPTSHFRSVNLVLWTLPE